MGRMSWKTPPPVVAIGGTETFLRNREILRAIIVTEQSGRRVVRADSDEEVVDNITMASTFGDACLVVVPIDKVEEETLREIQENQPDKTGVILKVEGKLDEKKFPALSLVPGAFQVQHNTPTARKEMSKVAVRFARTEAALLLGKNTKALDEKLAQALVSRAGSDLGTLSFEVAKMAALARSEGRDHITVQDVRDLLRPSSEVDMAPLRDALRTRDVGKVSKALERIRVTMASPDPMMLLRGRGGMEDLATKWLRTALLLERGASIEEISARTGTPPYFTKTDLVPSAKRWGASRLRKLVFLLSRVDRGILLGSPSPWVSFESALLIGCVG